MNGTVLIHETPEKGRTLMHDLPWALMKFGVVWINEMTDECIVKTIHYSGKTILSQ